MLPFLFYCCGWKLRVLSHRDDWNFFCGFFFFSPPLSSPCAWKLGASEPDWALTQHAHDKEHLQSLGAYLRPLPTVQLSLQTGQVLFWVLWLGLLGLVWFPPLLYFIASLLSYPDLPTLFHLLNKSPASEHCLWKHWDVLTLPGNSNKPLCCLCFFTLISLLCCRRY